MHAISLLVLLMAADPASPAGNGPLIDHCFVSLSDDVEISAQEAGPLVELVDEQGRVRPTREGQTVQRGMLLAQVDDQQPRLQRQAAQAEHDAAKAKADDDIEIRYSDAAYRVAQAEYVQAVEVNRKAGAIPLTEVRRLDLTQQRAKLQIERSRLEQSVARLEADVSKANVDAAQAAMERRRIVSPIDGVLMSVQKQPGEWVQAGEPVLRVARMDLLRVEGFVSAAEYNASELADRPVTVQLDLARGRKVELTGRVTFVSPLVQAGNRYRVRAEVQNRNEENQWLLRPGMPARMRVLVK